MFLSILSKKTGAFQLYLRFFQTSTMAKSKFEYVKNFETDEICLPNCWIVVRIDGKGFHKFTDLHNFEKPNDKRGLDLMTKAACSVFEELHDICFAFGHSDEYSFVFRKNTDLFTRRHDKLLSIVTSKFSAAYVYYWQDYFGPQKLKFPPSFDGRAVLYPADYNLRDYLSWRQADVHVNNLYNTVFWALVLKNKMTTKQAEERLKGTLASDKNEILFSEFNINYNKEPEQFKKGTTLVRKILKQDNAKPILVVVALYIDLIRDKFWIDNPEILEGKPAREFSNVDNSPVFPIIKKKNYG